LICENIIYISHIITYMKTTTYTYHNWFYFFFSRRNEM